MHPMDPYALQEWFKVLDSGLSALAAMLLVMFFVLFFMVRGLANELAAIRKMLEESHK